MKGYEMRIEVYGECGEPVSMVANHIGSLMHEQRKLSEAEKWYKASVEVDIDDPVVWMGLNNFAELLQKKYFGEKNHILLRFAPT